MNKPEVLMGVMDAIYERRSVRSYTPQKPDPETVNALLMAAVQAPTAVHEEPWAFVVIQDRLLLERISDRAKTFFVEDLRRAHLDAGWHGIGMFEKPDFNIFYNAGTLIVICGRAMAPSMERFVAADCWLAAENMMLAACAMGLSTCVIGSAVTGLNTPELKAELGIPADTIAIAPIIVGVSNVETPTGSRKAPRILTWK